MPNQIYYDLFISFADNDAQWVNGYLMPELGLSPDRLMTREKFEPGVDTLVEFERAISQSRYTLLILSPAFFLMDRWDEYSDRLVAYARVRDARNQLIPLKLKPCELPLHIDAINKLDCTGDDPEKWQREIKRLRDLLNLPEPPSETLPCPYPGLKAFTEDNSEYFFGREVEIQELLGKLRQHPFIAVIGPSGIGKSSLVFAGLIPQLAKSSYFQGKKWHIEKTRPAGFADLVTEKLNKPLEENEQLFFIIDQCEELFYLLETQKMPFQEKFVQILEKPNCYLILTIRADFYPELMMTSSCWNTIKSHRVEVVPLDANGLRNAIKKPAEQAGVYIEDALVERLVNDAAKEPGFLPLIQETLVLLWEHLERRYLSLKAYEKVSYQKESPLKGLKAAIASHADATLANLNEPQQMIARRIFLRLIQFGEGRPDTRRQQSLNDLRGNENSRLFDDTIKHLTRNRLLTLSGTQEDKRDRKVDIAHEALITGWPQLQQWIKEWRAAELTRRELKAKVDNWEKLTRKGGLLDVFELQEAEKWQKSADVRELGEPENLFELIKASQKAIKNELRRLRSLLVFAVIFALLATIAAGVAWKQTQVAEQQTQVAEQRGEKLANSLERETKQREQAQYTKSLFLSDLSKQQITKDNTTLGILLALEAFPKDSYRDYPQAKSSLYQAVYKHREHLILKGHTGDVVHATFSPNGNKVVTASDDGTIRLWNARNGKLLKVLLHKNPTTRAIFHPNGNRIAIVLYNIIYLWDVNNEKRLKDLLEHQWRIRHIVFSPDGKYLLSVSSDKTILWNINNGEFKVLKEQEDKITYAAFNSSSSHVVTSGADKTVRIWDVDSTKVVNVLQGHEEKVNYATFNADGTLVVTASDDDTARIWNLTNGTSIVLGGHKGNVNYANFSPDKKYIVTTSETEAYLWNINGELVKKLSEHEGWIKNVFFSQNGTHLITISGHTVRIWNAGNGQLLSILRGHKKEVKHWAFSPDSTYFVMAGADSIARIWKVNSDLLLQVLPEKHENQIIQLSLSQSTAFSFDGTRIITSYQKPHIARIWDTKGKLIAELPGHSERINHVAFNHDNSRVVTASEDHTARIWDANNGELLKVLTGHKEEVIYAAFNFDGTRIITTSSDNIAHLWDSNTGKILSTLQGYNLPDGSKTERLLYATFNFKGDRILTISSPGMAQIWEVDDRNLLKEIKKWSLFFDNFDTNYPIYSVTHAIFSPMDNYVATASHEGIVRLWDATTGKLLEKLEGHDRSIQYINFSFDGTRIITASFDNTARIWNIKNNKKFIELQGHKIGVMHAIFSSDGTLASTASLDGTARLWDVSTGLLLAVLPVTSNIVYRTAFSSDRKHVLTASNNGDVHLWRIFADTKTLIDYANQIVPRCLTSKERKQFFLPEVEIDTQIFSTEVETLVLTHQGEVETLGSQIEVVALKFKKAIQNIPCFKFDPFEKARQIAASVLIGQGEKLAEKEGQVETAIVKFKQAQKIDERFQFNSEQYAQQLALPIFQDLLESGVLLSIEKKEKLINIYMALSKGDVLNLSYEESIGICLIGMELKREEDVKKACIQMSKQAYKKAKSDMRGITRGITRGILKKFLPVLPNSQDSE